MVLVVDLEGVGQDMLAVPIKADCKVPKVEVSPQDYLEYGKCFLRYSTSREIKIVNDDNLKAKFEIIDQDEQSKRIGIYTADIMKGEIEPKSTQIVNIKLKTEIIGQVRIPFYIKLEGEYLPNLLQIVAESIGPIVEVDKTELDYGNVTVLEDKDDKICITNKSEIDADYTAFTKNKESIWKVQERHGVLKPDETKQIKVTCNADEAQKFQDTLHIIVNNGVDQEVALKAKGTGSTLFCK